MSFTQQQIAVIKNCQKSVVYFLEHFGKVKHPSAGVLDFKPFKYQITALKAFRQYKYNIFKKCRQCFDGSAMVWGPYGPKRIDQIKPGDQVYSLCKTTGQLVTVTVQEAYDNGERECVRVRTYGGHDTVATVDHQYFTTAGEKSAGELTPEDAVIDVQEPIRYAAGKDVITLGYMFSNSVCTSDSVLYKTMSMKCLCELQTQMEKEFGVRGKLNVNNNFSPPEYYLTLQGKDIVDWLTGLGVFSTVLPEVVFSWNRQDLALFFSRLFSSPNWQDRPNKDGTWVAPSMECAHQIRQLLSRLGIASTVEENPRLHPTVTLAGKAAFERFNQLIRINSSNKRLTCTDKCDEPSSKVKDVTPVGKRKVYDLRVPPYDNYVVDGVVVHNSGISKISGAFALWFGMFNPYKTILIVSKTDVDAMTFLAENVGFLFDNLPDWMREAWDPIKRSEHEIYLANGTKIRSLTSAPDVLRSNAASLNIIDEAAFIQNMSAIWTGGWSTLQHGGNIIVISTTNGLGNWYWSTYTDAITGNNEFNPLIIDWWDMDWAIEYVDPLSGSKRRIAPTDGIRDCVTPQELQKYGQKWSPWLEEQYRALQEKGEPWRFQQEVLADFVGGGSTVIAPAALLKAAELVDDKYQTVTGIQTYVHPVTQERDELDFTPMGDEEGLRVWKPPVTGTPDKIKNGVVIERGRRAHSYVMGVDLASGKGRDFNAIEVIDVDTLEQVAEMMIHCLPMQLKKYIDRIGRWYNCALCVVERNFGGDAIIDELRIDYMYPRLWRRTSIDDRPTNDNDAKVRYDTYGFMTGQASKASMNKLLVDSIREDGGGLKIYSNRLMKQLNIYVRKKDRAGRDTYKTEAQEGPGNHDDLVMAIGLALIGLDDASSADATSLLPIQNKSGDMGLSYADVKVQQDKMIELGGPALLMPCAMAPDDAPDISAMRDLEKFMMQMGGISITQQTVPVQTEKKHILLPPRKS